MRKVLQQDFFCKDAFFVAERLLGKFLVRKINGKELAYMISEIEVYHGFEDKASHASKGKTKRNEPMFRKGGVFYIYLIYGMYYMLNIVTDRNEFPSAILIRGLCTISGPGRITKYLKIDKSFNGKSISKDTGLWIEDRGIKIKKDDIEKTKRVGIDYAEDWAEKPYRFLLKNCDDYLKKS